MAKEQDATGLVRYNLNHKVEISFDPNDPGFVRRLSEAFSKAHLLDEEQRKRILETRNHKRIYEISVKAEQNIRDILNGLFGVEVCEPLFGNVSCTAQETTTGFPLWRNLLLAIFDQIPGELQEQAKRDSPQLAAVCLKRRRL